jgi:hypothetical protein
MPLGATQCHLSDWKSCAIEWKVLICDRAEEPVRGHAGTWKFTGAVRPAKPLGCLSVGVQDIFGELPFKRVTSLEGIDPVPFQKIIVG